MASIPALWIPCLAFAVVFAGFWLAKMAIMLHPKAYRAIKQRMTGKKPNLEEQVSRIWSFRSPNSGEHRLAMPQLATKRLQLEWRDLSCLYQTNQGTKVVLKDVSGIARPGEMLALMGPSGAGKSTLLDILAERKRTGQLTGSVLVNGVPRDADFRRQTAYVPQEDNFLPTLTVEETASMYASLLLPSSFKKNERRARMLAVLAEMGLAETENTLVGGTLPGGFQLRGLSGGERKRLSIAVGIIGAPSIIFLDEPTSGLDSFAALSVMGCMRNMAHHMDHTVITSIHQPRAAIWAMFDTAVVLSKGMLLYYGPRSGMVPWFSDYLGYQFDPNLHGVPSDWAMDLVNVGFHKPQEFYGHMMNQRRELVAAADAYRKHYMQYGAEFNPAIAPPANASALPVSADAAAAVNEAPASGGAAPVSKVHSMKGSSVAADPESLVAVPGAKIDSSASSVSSEADAGPAAVAQRDQESRVAVPLGSSLTPRSSLRSRAKQGLNLLAGRDQHNATWLAQFRVLLWREMISATRNPADVAGRMMVFAIVALFFGVVFYDLGFTLDGMRNRLNIMFVLPVMLMLLPYVYMSLYTADKKYFIADASARLYRTSAFYIAKTVAILPFAILNILVLTFIFYGMAGLNPAVSSIWEAGAVSILLYLVSQQVLALAAVIMPNQDTAFMVAIGWTSLNILISNYLIRYKDMYNRWISGLRYISAMHFAFKGYSEAEFGGGISYNCEGGVSEDLITFLTSVLPSKARQFNQFVRPQLTPPQFNQPGSMLMRDATSGRDVTVSVPCSVNPGAVLVYYNVTQPVWEVVLVLIAYLIVLHIATYMGYRRLTNKEQR